MKHLQLFNFTVSILLLNLCINQASGIFNCNPVWVQSSRGSQGDLEYPITSDGRNHYVARIPSPSIPGEYLLGRVDFATGNGYFSESDLIETTYEILGNPYDCNVEWVSPASSLVPNYVVKSISTTVGRTWVGRGELPDGSLVPGYINPTTKELTLVDNDGNIVTINETSYDVLVSYSNGMELDINELVFDTNPFAGPIEMMGMDVVDNNANTTVEQTVEHVKVASESYKFSTTRITSVKTIRIRWCLFFCISTSTTTHSETTTEFSSHQDKEVKASRSIKVPSFTSVESCSTFSKQDNFESTWSAKAVFTSKGQSGAEILEILKADPNWANNEFVLGDTSVETTITGSFQGAFVASSRIYVVEKSTGVCSQLQEYLKSSKTDKSRQWTLEDSIRQDTEIANIFASLL